MFKVIHMQFLRDTGVLLKRYKLEKIGPFGPIGIIYLLTIIDKKNLAKKIIFYSSVGCGVLIASREIICMLRTIERSYAR